MRYPTLAILLCAPLASCYHQPTEAVCIGIGWIPIVAEIRDQHGRPAAIGATVRIERADGYTDQTWGFGDDPLRVGVGEPVTGVFDVTVSKPYHDGSTVRGVEVRGDPVCGIPSEPGRPQLTVSLRDDAPPVRQVVVPPFSYAFLDGNVTSQTLAQVEADEGVSREVLWVSRDTTVARVSPDGTITSACRSTHGNTFLVASAVADPAVKDSVAVSVWRADWPSGRCP